MTVEQIILAAAGAATVAAIVLVVWFAKPIAHFLRVLLTEDDANEVWCMARVGWLLGLITFVVLAIVHVAVNHATFDYLGFGGGFGALNAAGGGALALKGKL